MNIGCTLPPQSQTVNQLNRSQNESLSMRKKRRHSFQQDERKSKKAAKLVSCQQQIHNAYEKFYRNMNRVPPYTDEEITSNKDSKSNLFSGSVNVEEKNGKEIDNLRSIIIWKPPLLQKQAEEMVSKACVRLSAGESCDLHKGPLSANGSSTELIRCRDAISEQQQRIGDENPNCTDTLNSIPIGADDNDVKCVLGQDDYNLMSSQGNVNDIDEYPTTNSQNNLCAYNTEEHNHNVNITNQYNQHFVSHLSPPNISCNAPHYPVSSPYVYQNINNSVQLQVCNNQAAVNPYFYVLANPYAPWQSAQFYSQPVMYPIPGFYYMYCPVPTEAPPNAFWPTPYGQGVPNFQTFVSQQHPPLNSTCDNHSQGTKDPNQSMFSQFDYIAENSPVHFENTVESGFQVGEFYHENEELQDLYTNPYFDALAGSNPSIKIEPSTESHEKIWSLYEVSREPLELQDLYKNPLFGSQSRSSMYLGDFLKE